MTEPNYQELYEQSKKVIRQMCIDAGIAEEGGPAFILACHECGYPYRKDLEVGMAMEHAKLVHNLDEDTDKLKLDLIFIGKGDPPKGS